MRINFILTAAFLSITIAAFNSDNIRRIGGTQLNGNGCVCHTTEESTNVHVWVEGPDSMYAGQTAEFKMYMFGGPAIAGGYNVAVRYGQLSLEDTIFSKLIDNELTQNYPIPFPTIYDTIFWPFLYTAPDSVDIDTMYSVGLSTNWDSIPDDRDQWAYGPKFPIRIIENTVPVELISFNIELVDSKVLLTWSTASEKNNRGFVLERKVLSPQSSISKMEFEKIGFVEGKGTSTTIQYYTFADVNVSNGKYLYRLKQIDFDGSFSYSKEIEVDVNTAPTEFKLYQNYPNPFNPGTRIRFTIPLSFGEGLGVRLLVYDVLGNEVAALVNEYKSAGTYEVEFNPASSINHSASGVYYYQLKAGNYTETKKMILLR